jgi:transcriptional regulator with XRE-family HTH domain
MTAPAALRHALDPAALREARQAAGRTLADASRAVGRDLSVVARYERGEVDPPASVLGTLAGLYGVGVGVFYTTQ